MQLRNIPPPLLGVTGQIIPETRALAARFTVPPTLPRLRTINRLMVALKGCGFLAALDVLIVPGADEQCSRQNWVQNAWNATYYPSKPSPGFTPYYGFFSHTGSDESGSSAILGEHLIFGGLQANTPGRKLGTNLTMIGAYVTAPIAGNSNSIQHTIAGDGYGLPLTANRANNVAGAQVWNNRPLPTLLPSLVTAQVGHFTQMYWTGNYGYWINGEIAHATPLSLSGPPTSGPLRLLATNNTSGATPQGNDRQTVGIFYQGRPVPIPVLQAAHQAFSRYYADINAEAALDGTPPTYLGATNISVPEGTTLEYGLFANEPVTWSVVGGADGGHFSIAGGNLLTMAPKSYASPVDADTNNVYQVVVRASDAGGNVTNLGFSVTVTQTSVPGGGAMDFQTNENSGLVVII